MTEVIIQSELEAFKANLPQQEIILAEWFMKTLRKGRLIHSHRTGNHYLILCTDMALYLIKLTAKRGIDSHKRYSLLDFTNIQVGYLSKGGEDALDECEVNPGLFAIRLHLGPKVFKTFKHPNDELEDDAQKAFIQVIFSSLKAGRRELYRVTPQSAPIAIPSKQTPNPSPGNTPLSLSASFRSMKQDSFMITLPGFLLNYNETNEPVEGMITITQKHFVFEPSALMEDVVECSLLADDEVPMDAREFTMSKSAKVLQLFADGSKMCFPLAAANHKMYYDHIDSRKQDAGSAHTRLQQWVQQAQDKLAQEIISQTAIQHPLLAKDDNTTNFKGDSDILSAKDILYYKMPERHSMDRWELVYSTTRHGISINTFFTKVHDRAPSVIVVEDTNHHIFGGYASEPWVKTKQVHYGSGESFLFKIKPVCKIFKWSKLNDYFMYSKPDFISFGSGGGGYGLWLDSEFEHGSSATSDTYQNEPLSNTEIFKVLKIEVWAPPIYFQKKQPRPL